MKTLNEYQTAAMRTASFGPGGQVKTRRQFEAMVFALGLTGESGEVADLIKKGYGHGHGVDEEKLAKELGDVLWYLAVLAATFGYSLETVAALNVEKLKARYPDGFSYAASIARVDVDPKPPSCGGTRCVQTEHGGIMHSTKSYSSCSEERVGDDE